MGGSLHNYHLAFPLHRIKFQTVFIHWFSSRVSVKGIKFVLDENDAQKAQQKHENNNTNFYSSGHKKYTIMFQNFLLG
jgi:hypothetical protein